MQSCLDIGISLMTQNSAYKHTQIRLIYYLPYLMIYTYSIYIFVIRISQDSGITFSGKAAFEFGRNKVPKKVLKYCLGRQPTIQAFRRRTHTNRVIRKKATHYCLRLAQGKDMTERDNSPECHVHFYIYIYIYIYICI